MTLAGTGHRPNKLGYEYDGTGVYSNAIRYALQEQINVLKPTKGISGMAIGYDMLLAEAFILNRIPFIAAIPCIGQESTWPPKSRDRYNRILDSSLCTKHFVSLSSYDDKCMQNRNIWMVDQLTEPNDRLLALSNGSSGGTMNCLRYAATKLPANRIIVIHPKTVLMEYDKHIKLSSQH